MPAGFDTIALGPDLTTALCAALLARHGQRVLLVTGQRPRTTVRLGQLTLPAAPRPLAALGCELVQELMAALGLTHLLRPATQQEVVFQLITPRARLDLSPDDELLLAELQRELDLSPAGGRRDLVRLARTSRQLGQLMRQPRLLLQPDEPLAPTSVAPTPPRPQEPVLTCLTDAPLAAAPLCTRAVGHPARARLLSHWRRPQPQLEGGLPALELALHELILAAGGEVLAGVEPRQLLASPDGTPRGVQLDLRSTTLLAKRFLVGLRPDWLRRPEMLGPLPWLPRTRVCGVRHTRLLVLGRRWLPASMAQRLVLQPTTPGGPAAWATVLDPDPRSDQIALALVGTAPSAAHNDLRRGDGWLMAQAQRLIPFLPQGLVASCAPELELAQPALPVLCPQEPLAERASLAAGLPAWPLRPGPERLVLCHPAMLGALAMEGAAATAMGAAAALG